MDATASKPSTNTDGKNAKPRIIAPILAIMPLSLSVIPWGILCGTLSIEAGLTSFQAQLMSLIIFAGAAQISGISILGSAGTWINLFNSTSMISVRHTLYSATYKNLITPLPFYKRVLFAFLLTDEMFVVAQADQLKTGRFDYSYAIIAGLTFYIIWNVSTLMGILSAHLISDIDNLGFDFAIAATFIAMVIPMIKNKIIAIAIIVSAVSSYLFAYWGISNGLMFAALLGMTVGAILSRFDERNHPLIADGSDAAEYKHMLSQEIKTENKDANSNDIESPNKGAK